MPRLQFQDPGNCIADALGSLMRQAIHYINRPGYLGTTKQFIYRIKYLTSASPSTTSNPNLVIQTLDTDTETINKRTR
ncbi:MAG: hypothetical protein A2Y32_13335 [Spirochaetes bacterium GWF1_60_12]|nr:MAG: hypothetical protein A2Y32_13335 [Spirochaetes bacterium GWF1_60_12]